MKVLVTGGAGLIGSHIADLFYAKGYKIRILDNLAEDTHQGKPKWLDKRYEFIKGDVRNKMVVQKALEGVDYVFHQAAYGGFTSEITKYVLSNTLGIANILEVIQEQKIKIKKLVVASSQAIYGEGKYQCPAHGALEPQLRSRMQLLRSAWEVECPKCQNQLVPIPTDEYKFPDPGTAYAVTKYSQERLVIKIGQAIGVPTVALRYAVTFGPRQSLFNPYTGIVSIFSTRILNNLPPVIYEDGKQTRDLIFVEDVAQANFLVSQKEEADYQVYNVSSSIPVTILELARILNEAYSRNIIPVIKNEFRPGEVRHLYLDNAKLKQLGWKPKFTISQGIKKYIDWIKTQGDIKEYFTKAQDMMRKEGVVVRVKI